MSESVVVREYVISYYDDASTPYIQVQNGGQRDTYLPVPTVAEAREAFGVSESTEVTYINLFQNITNAAFPRIPEGGKTYQNVFRSSGVVVPPSIPKGNASLYYLFRDCLSLLQPATIPSGAKNIDYLYRGCSALLYPASIPPSTGSRQYFYDGCVNIEGEFIFRPTSGSVSYFLRNTTKTLIIYGDQTICQSIAATANNGNASWQPWYDPIPAVTNRGQGSYTTAADMTRMVRNGALAVSSYAPGRMVYQRGDIVREDEWNALVEAAQTIDPTITYSTVYTNLNKIEAAFDSAL